MRDPSAETRQRIRVKLLPPAAAAGGGIKAHTKGRGGAANGAANGVANGAGAGNGAAHGDNSACDSGGGGGYGGGELVAVTIENLTLLEAVDNSAALVSPNTSVA